MKFLFASSNPDALEIQNDGRRFAVYEPPAPVPRYVWPAGYSCGTPGCAGEHQSKYEVCPHE